MDLSTSFTRACHCIAGEQYVDRASDGIFGDPVTANRQRETLQERTLCQTMNTVLDRILQYRSHLIEYWNHSRR